MDYGKPYDVHGGGIVVGPAPLFVHGVGHYHPPELVTNRFLESLDIGTTEEWILRRVGIRQRHTALPLDYIRSTRNVNPAAAREAAVLSPVDMGVAAARMALERASVPPSAVGLVVAGGSSPDYGAPACASLIACALGIEAPAFDLNAACSTFAYQLHFVRTLARATAPDFILLVIPESLTKSVDYRDRNAAVLMGDGAAAAVVSLTQVAPARCELTAVGAKSSEWQKVTIRAGGHLQQDGPSVQAFAIRQTTALVREADAPFRFVGHQANLRMLQAVCARSGVAPDQHDFNVDARGNCGGAGAASVVSENWATYVAHREKVLLTVVGAGLSWGSATLNFAGVPD